MLDLNGLRELLLHIDPGLTQYVATGKSGAYTVWSPLGLTTRMAEDSPDDVFQRVQIDRYEPRPDDTVVMQIIRELDAAHVPQSDPITDHEPQNGVFRWIITCEVRRI